MGVVGLTAPEAAGGMGMDEVDLVLLLEEAGRAALPEPIVEHTAVAIPTLRMYGGDRGTSWLERAAAGDALLAVGIGEPYPVYAEQADALLLNHGNEVHLVERGDVTFTPQRSVD
jgi:alkylation response protein AidB-like acyl-CoA dehydrogenase